jgi:predicted nucleotide-binding protein
MRIDELESSTDLSRGWISKSLNDMILSGLCKIAHGHTDDPRTACVITDEGRKAVYDRELTFDDAEPKQRRVSPPGVAGSKVFVVHGHDEEMKKAVQLLLTRARLDDVVLHECPDRGRTIIDKLVEEGREAGYVVALLTPDDLLADGTLRARQNVILEIGYFIGLLGKERVRLLKRGSVEIPSDLRGILFEEYDDAGNWRLKLLKEIKAVGIEVDVDAVLGKL